MRVSKPAQDLLKIKIHLHIQKCLFGLQEGYAF